LPANSSRATPELLLDSVTGVDLALPVAGAGARCYAFVIDWLIRAIMFVAWYGVAALIYNGRWSFTAPLNPDPHWFVFVVAPAAGTYFLYHIVLELALHGRTPGKRLARVHIVARDGSSPKVGALLTRNVFRLVDSLPLFYGIGLVTTLVTKDHIRIGDMAAGTLLAYERTDVTLPNAVNAEIASDLLARWSSLTLDARRRLAIEILSRSGYGGTETTTDAALRAQLEQLSRGPRG
jgi:uncharacterized RDD family membrane protein YckC